MIFQHVTGCELDLAPAQYQQLLQKDSEVFIWQNVKTFSVAVSLSKDSQQSETY